MVSKKDKKKYGKEYHLKNKEKRKLYAAQYYKENKEDIKKRVKKYRNEKPENKDKKKARSKRYREKNPLGYRLSNWKNRGINITIDSYNDIHKKQHGKCAICGIKESELKYKLCLDHDHRNGEPRGLLCRRCNSTLGMFEKNNNKSFCDPISLFRNAIKYIENSKSHKPITKI